MAVISEKQITINARRATDAGRHYDVEGDLLPSVTLIESVIAKPALVPWAAKMERLAALEAAANLYEDVHGTPRMSRASFISTLTARIGKTKASQKEMEKAGEIGSQAHNLIEWNLRKSLGQVVGMEPHVTDAAKWAFMACQDWIQSVNLKPVSIEQVVFNLEYGYAGTLDLLGYITRNGKTQLAIVDWKTGKAIYAEARLQQSAYAFALKSMGHQMPDTGLIVRLPKLQTDPEFEVVEVDNMEEEFRVFLHVLEVYKWSAKHEAEYRKRVDDEKRVLIQQLQELRDLKLIDLPTYEAKESK